MESIGGSHTAQNHRSIQERINPVQLSQTVISKYSDSQTYTEDKEREDEMANYSLCKLSRAEQRLLSMFVHEAFNNCLLRRMRATARRDEDTLL
jgi:hypothetical protein